MIVQPMYITPKIFTVAPSPIELDLSKDMQLGQGGNSAGGHPTGEGLSHHGREGEVETAENHLRRDADQASNMRLTAIAGIQSSSYRRQLERGSLFEGTSVRITVRIGYTVKVIEADYFDMIGTIRAEIESWFNHEVEFSFLLRGRPITDFDQTFWELEWTQHDILELWVPLKGGAKKPVSKEQSRSNAQRRIVKKGFKDMKEKDQGIADVGRQKDAEKRFTNAVDMKVKEILSVDVVSEGVPVAPERKPLPTRVPIAKGESVLHVDTDRLDRQLAKAENASERIRIAKQFIASPIARQDNPRYVNPEIVLKAERQKKWEDKIKLVEYVGGFLKYSFHEVEPEKDMWKTHLWESTGYAKLAAISWMMPTMLYYVSKIHGVGWACNRLFGQQGFREMLQAAPYVPDIIAYSQAMATSIVLKKYLARTAAMMMAAYIVRAGYSYATKSQETKHTYTVHNAEKQEDHRDDTDLRPDSITLQAIKHNHPVLAKAIYKKERYFRLGGKKFWRRTIEETEMEGGISKELFSQITTSRNIGPGLRDDAVSMRLQQQANNINTINFNRYDKLERKNVVENTILFSFGYYKHNMEKTYDKVPFPKPL